MAVSVHTAFIADREITYDGRQLAPHWIYRQFDSDEHPMRGNAVVAFVGPCNVELTEMVDIEDVKNSAPIYSPRMLHLIAEFFDGDLHQTVYRQRLLIVTAKELLETMIERPIARTGDDLYISRTDGTKGKLSVSIATASTTSTLIHTGFNVDTEGTPVPTVGLSEFGIDVADFATRLLATYAQEIEDIWFARCKVRSVSE